MLAPLWVRFLILGVISAVSEQKSRREQGFTPKAGA
jgi:hypothetical protein